jgi:hypothetical protein
MIEENRLQMEDGGVYGDLDENLDFQPLTEKEMVAKSLDVLAEYKRTGIGIPPVTWTPAALIEVRQHYQRLEPIDLDAALRARDVIRRAGDSLKERTRYA